MLSARTGSASSIADEGGAGGVFITGVGMAADGRRTAVPSQASSFRFGASARTASNLNLNLAATANGSPIHQPQPQPQLSSTNASFVAPQQRSSYHGSSSRHDLYGASTYLERRAEREAEAERRAMAERAAAEAAAKRAEKAAEKRKRAKAKALAALEARHAAAVADYPIHQRVEMLHKIFQTLVTAYHPQVGDALHAHVPTASSAAVTTVGGAVSPTPSAGRSPAAARAMAAEHQAIATLLGGGGGGKGGGTAKSGGGGRMPPSPTAAAANSGAVTLQGYGLGVARCLLACAEVSEVPAFPHHRAHQIASSSAEVGENSNHRHDTSHLFGQSDRQAAGMGRGARDVAVAAAMLGGVGIHLLSPIPVTSVEGGQSAASNGVSEALDALAAAVGDFNNNNTSKKKPDGDGEGVGSPFAFATTQFAVSSPALLFLKYLHFNARHMLACSGNIAAVITLYRRALHIATVLREAAHAWEERCGLLSQNQDGGPAADNCSDLSSSTSSSSSSRASSGWGASFAGTAVGGPADANDDEAAAEAAARDASDESAEAAAARARVLAVKRLVVVLICRLQLTIDALKDAQLRLSNS